MTMSNNSLDKPQLSPKDSKRLIELLVKTSHKDLKEIATKLGLTTLGTKTELQLRFGRYFSESLRTEDKDPTFIGCYSLSQTLQVGVHETFKLNIESPTENLSEESSIDSNDPNITSLTEQIKQLQLNDNTIIDTQETNRNLSLTISEISTIPTPERENYPINPPINHNKKMTPKITIKNYAGLPSEDLEQFITAFNKFAKLHDWTNDKKVDYITFYLEGAALRSTQNFVKEDNKTWEQVVAHLKSRFTQDKILDYTIELQYLKLDGQRPLATYISLVETYCDALNLGEEMKIIHLIKGLPVSMIDKMDVLDNSTFQKSIENLHKIQLGRKMIDERIRSSISNNTQTNSDTATSETIKNLTGKIEDLT